MQRLAGRAIFSVGERVFTWEDVVLAAYLWGDVAQIEQRIARAIAADRALAKRGEQPSEDEVDDAATRWRYDHDLIAADDLDGWLAARKLDADEWLAYIRRAESLARAGTAPLRGRPSADVDAALYAEAMCSGAIGDLTDRLARCAAAHDRAAAGKRTAAFPAAKLRAAMDRLPPSVAKGGLYALSAAETRRRAADIVEMTAAADRFAKQVGAGEAIEREVEAHVLEWTRLRLRTLRFDAEEAAREAALLIRQDGFTIAKVAAAAKTRARTADVVLEDAASTLRDRLVGARTADLVGPVADDGAFIVAVVEERIAPSSADPLVRERARARVVRRALGAEVDRRIRWHERF